jgi:hypothetical protein
MLSSTLNVRLKERGSSMGNNRNTSNPSVHPWLVISSEEVDRSHMCVTCCLCNEDEIFIY